MRKPSSSSIGRWTTVRLLVDILMFVSLGFQSRARLAAENLFLRKQLALYGERPVKSRRADDATRITLVVLARLIDWRAALTIVQPDTLIRWHFKGLPPEGDQGDRYQALSSAVQAAQDPRLAPLGQLADCSSSRAGEGSRKIHQSSEPQTARFS